MPKPFTISYGPWAPDLQNVATEVPFQWTSTTLPCSDVSNVYWQDGAFRSMPGLASSGPSLGIPVTNAVTWFDESTDTEEVFAATANGVWMLANGAWSAVPVQTNASSTAVGAQISLTLGSPNYLTLSPSSQTLSGTGSTFTFPAETIGGATGGVFSWSVSGASGGTFSVANGQGTNSSQAQVMGVTAGTTATASYNCLVTVNGIASTLTASLSFGYMTGSISGNATGGGIGTVTTNSVTASESAGVAPITYLWSPPAGATATNPNSATTAFSASTNVNGTAVCVITDANGTFVEPGTNVTITSGYTGTMTAGNDGGVLFGYLSGIAGSISPTTDGSGYTVADLYDNTTNSKLALSITGTSSPPPSNYFTTLTINSTNKSSASASYGTSGNTATWTWSGQYGFVDGNQYTVKYS